MIKIFKLLSNLSYIKSNINLIPKTNWQERPDNKLTTYFSNNVFVSIERGYKFKNIISFEITTDKSLTDCKILSEDLYKCLSNLNKLKESDII